MKHNYLANRYFTDGQFQCYELLHSSKVMAETIHFIENVNLKAQLINNKTYKE